MDLNELLFVCYSIFIEVHVRLENEEKEIPETLFFFFPPAEEDRPIKHLIQPGPGASLCPAKQYNSYTIYGLSSVQVAEKLLGHTCQLIHPLDYAPHCLLPPSPEDVPHQVQRHRNHDGLLQIWHSLPRKPLLSSVNEATGCIFSVHYWELLFSHYNKWFQECFDQKACIEVK